MKANGNYDFSDKKPLILSLISMYIDFINYHIRTVSGWSVAGCKYVSILHKNTEDVYHSHTKYLLSNCE